MSSTLIESNGRRIGSADGLHEWVLVHTGMSIGRSAVCPGHDAPFEYLKEAYFEPSKDLVVWAPRGGGKTALGAVATLLDLLKKRNCQVRILGGSLEQSLRMWEHLYPMLLETARKQMVGNARARIVRLENRSTAAVLTQSQRAVRGLRVQKLRCDEVELFDPAIWQAGQLVTKSVRGEGEGVRGTIEALSTLHTPFGLMHRIVENAQRNGTRVIRWCLMEVLERCPAERECASCPLWEECRGVAKTKCDGFVSIDDAIAMKQRVSLETWQCEMLCQRPSTRHAVFPTFLVERHVVEEILTEKRATERRSDEATEGKAAEGSISLAIDFGFASPFVCLWIVRLGAMTHVIDEYVQPGRLLEEHIEQIRRRTWAARIVCCDPAGNARNDQTSVSNVAMLRKAGFVVRTRGSGIVDGLEMIRTALAPAAGKPRLFIHPRCTRLIKALQSYRYAEGGSELPVKDGEHDHLIDPLRYHFVNWSVSTAVTIRAY